jgi:hypothetical protein
MSVVVNRAATAQAGPRRRRGLWAVGGTLLLTAGMAAALGGLAERRVAALRHGWSYRPIEAETTRVVNLEGAHAATSLSDVSPLIVLAVVASEDRRFFQHRGFDVAEMGNAFADALDGHPLRGASTITQQVAKNLFVSNERSVGRKLREAVYTIALERELTKDDILRVYLDTIEWGDGIYGVVAASTHYFGVAPTAVTLEQAALLASLVPAPRRRGRALERGSLTPIGLPWLVQRLRRLHLLIGSLAGGDPHALRLEQVRTASIDALIDAGAPSPAVARAAHRSWRRIHADLHARARDPR